MGLLKKRTIADNMFETAVYLFMIVFCLSTIYPFWTLLSLSLTSSQIPVTETHLIPPIFSLESYSKVFADQELLIGLKNTIVRTVLGSICSLIFMVLMAYPLSKKHLPHRTFWTALVVFTMYFNGGLIPNYLLVKSLGLYNSTMALILPSLINTFQMIIVRNFFMAIPDSMEESAKIDGANDVVILFRIILPLSMPIIATVLLWTSVWHWNEWFNALIYITDSKKQVLQNVMRRIVLDGTTEMFREMTNEGDIPINPENLKAAVVMFTTLPIIMVYPFAQKYFIKGIMIGSLKG